MISLERQGGNLGVLVILSALVSVQLAQKLNAKELALLSAFFEVLGDDLALLALSTDSESGSSTTCNGLTKGQRGPA